jgi:chromosome segregation ATPase
MKILTQLAQRLGVVRATHYRVALGQQRKAEARLAGLLGESEKLRTAAHAWKEKSETLSEALKQAQAYGKASHHDAERARRAAATAEREMRRVQRDAEDAERKSTRHVQQLQDAVTRAEERNTRMQAELESLTRRLGEAERDLKVARENLMVIEVKLDILEGAASVLDRRTRVNGVRQSASGTPV